MPPLRRFFEVVHITAAALWLGVAVATGAAAAIIFPTVKDLDPTLAAYPDYAGEHWRLAAGHIAARIFAFGDIVAFICLMLAGFTLTAIAAMRSTWITTPKLTLTRLCALGLAILAAGYNIFILGPRMNGNLQDYWQAAADGNNQAATIAQQAFMADHAPASNTLAAIALAALAMVITAALALTARPAKASNKPASPLQEPALTNRKR